ncbi:unnamed protein product [Polarella glacialis]|uniref:Peptidylamidoglycolate lyase n=1 Tax=Polarella glacialis TaxID=89957 RepID=A0A813LUK6_POLGL|nr:unnamed protein product [Polarella glacialis]
MVLLVLASRPAATLISTLFLAFTPLLHCADNTPGFKQPNFQNRYYQAEGYQGSRVLEHNQTGRFEHYVEVLWPTSSVVDHLGRVWIVDKRFHQVFMMETSSRYISWPAFYTEYSGRRDVSGHVDGSRLKARFDGPTGITLTQDPDKGLVLFVADTNNHCIRRLSWKTGRVVTIAGKAGFPGLKDGPAEESRFKQPQGVGVDFSGANLFILDNERRIRYVDLTQRALSVVTLTGGACREVMRWTVYEAVVLRTVGCHSDWSAVKAGEKDVEVFVSTESDGGDYYCFGHQATCSPRNHPALADRLSPQLISLDEAKANQPVTTPPPMMEKEERRLDYQGGGGRLAHWS